MKQTQAWTSLLHNNFVVPHTNLELPPCEKNSTEKVKRLWSHGFKVLQPHSLNIIVTDTEGVIAILKQR